MAIGRITILRDMSDIQDIRVGDVVTLKRKYYKNYIDKYNPQIVDIKAPTSVVKVGSTKMMLDGWSEIHKQKGGGLPISSFEKLSYRQVKILGIYKNEPKINKAVGQIQDFNDVTFSLCFVTADGVSVNTFSNYLIEGIVPLEKGAFVTVESNIQPGKQIIKFSTSTDAEIKSYGA